MEIALVNMLITIVVGFAITFVAIPSIIGVSKEKNLLDIPDNKRKKHDKKIPNLGGVAIFGGFIIASTLLLNIKEVPYIQHIISACCILFFIGLKDDIFPLSPIKKLLGEVFAFCIVIYFSDIRITSLYGVFGINELIYPVSFLFTLFTFIIVVNAFNLIDGINGLAGSIGVIICVTFGAWFLVSGNEQLAILSFSLVGSIMAFLYYNYTPAKMFMGDTGSLIIGFVSTVLAVKFIELNQEYCNGHAVLSSPAVAMSVMIVPIYDSLRVTILRLMKKQSPLTADRNHLHHLLLSKGYTHTQSTLVLCLFNIFIILFANQFQEIGTFQLIMIVFCICFVFFGTIRFVFPSKGRMLFKRKINSLQ